MLTIDATLSSHRILIFGAIQCIGILIPSKGSGKWNIHYIGLYKPMLYDGFIWKERVNLTICLLMQRSLNSRIRWGPFQLHCLQPIDLLKADHRNLWGSCCCYIVRGFVPTHRSRINRSPLVKVWPNVVPLASALSKTRFEFYSTFSDTPPIKRVIPLIGGSASE